MNGRSKLWLGWLAALAVLTGCTGIPASSAPQVVRTVEQSTGPDTTQHLGPQPGDPPPDIVTGFIDAGVDAGAGHSTARQFLTPKAASGWKDNQTVVLDDLNTGDPKISGNSAQVRVTGRRVGQLDANGIFSPTLKGMGSGDEEQFDFTLAKVNGQWRIDQPPPGVLIKRIPGFSDYHLRTLYFIDPAQNIVVPDPRYSSLSKQALATWLVAELIAGPRQELAQTVVNAVPDQVGRPTVKLGNPTIVDLPGVAQLDVSDRNQLATQLAFTLWQVDQVQFNGGKLELTDAGKPVRIPQAGGFQFGMKDFCSASLATTIPCPNSGSPGQLYFVRNGAVLLQNDGDGSIAPVSGPLGQPGRNFSSVALRQGSAGALRAAGLTGSGQLWIGSDQGLTPTRLPRSATSRPEWQPYSDNVWIGVGSRIYRVTAGGPALPVSLTSQVGALPAAPITAVRFSSDGDRLALVIRGLAGTGTVWVGSVVTAGADVRIDSLEPVTPPALSVTDVAWADTDVAWANATWLEMVAAEPGAEARVWSVYSDGSQLNRLANTDLPGPPVAIAATQGRSTVVTVGTAGSSSIWKEIGKRWVSLSGTDAPVYGTNPVYAF